MLGSCFKQDKFWPVPFQNATENLIIRFSHVGFALWCVNETPIFVLDFGSVKLDGKTKAANGLVCNDCKLLLNF